MFVKQAKEKTMTVNVVGDFIKTPTIAVVDLRNQKDIEKIFRTKFHDMIVRYIEESNTVVINRGGV
jgi:hypothetical protein